MQYEKITHSDLDGIMKLINTFAQRGWTLHSLHLPDKPDGGLCECVAILQTSDEEDARQQAKLSCRSGKRDTFLDA